MSADSDYLEAANRLALGWTASQIAEAEAFKLASAGCPNRVQKAGGPGCCDGFALRVGPHASAPRPAPKSTHSVAERMAARRAELTTTLERPRAGTEKE